MASSRLKRKLELDGGKGGSGGEFGNLNESFVSIGTPLPDLTDNKKDKNEFKPLWEQEVYDEQGRRRLHGAFTGGFSAGYYNTVGSKEGWTPSTFKSSRSNRAIQGQKNVADAAKQFMDEEDLAELASSRSLETNTAYSSASRSNASKPPPPADYDPLLGNFGSLSAPSSSTTTAPPLASFDDTLASLIQPSTSRVGLELMRKMGWRDGQGVGPRVTLAQRKRQAKELGIKLGNEGEEEEEDESGEAGKHLYAPLDRPLVLVKGSSASMDKGWGLGYQPGMTLDARLKKDGIASGAQRGGGAYGVDEDPYGDEGTGFSGMSSRGQRGFGNVDDEDEYRIASTSRGRQERKLSKKAPSTTQTFHDGTPVLPGFSLQQDRPILSNNSHLPPAPPPGWKPNPSRLWKENTPPSAPKDAKGKGKQLDADERGSLLGEVQPPPPPPVPKSVFDYLSAKSRDRLSSLTGTAPSNESFAATGTNSVPVSNNRNAPAAAPPPEPDEDLHVPILDRVTALAALKGFQPYSAASTSPDPVKQARYTLYLQYQTSPNPSPTSSPFGPRKLPNGKMQTVTELNRELSEYSQSAKVFKPVSGMLGNRFESSKSGSLDAPKIEPGLYQPPPKPDPSATTTSSSLSSDYLTSTYGNASTVPPEPPKPKLTPAQTAAREGNFGPLTRTTTQFRPAKLLCKRFGVRDPYEVGGEGETGSVGGGVGGAFGEATKTGWSTGEATRTSQPIGQDVMDQMMQSSGFKRFQEASKVVDEDEPEVAKGVFETTNEGNQGSVKNSNGNKARPTIETVGMGDDEAQGQEIVEEEKAPADIFAAIFADSDDDDSDEEEQSFEQPVAGASSATTVLSIDPVTAPSPSVPQAPPPPPQIDEAVASEPLSLETISSYKPSFVSSNSITTTNRTDPTTSSKKSSSSSSKPKKSKRKVALSFDTEDGDEGGEESRESRRPEKKKKKTTMKGDSGRMKEEKGEKKRVGAGEGEEEDEWEVAPSQVHPSIVEVSKASSSSLSMPPPPVPSSSNVPKARMKASDLY